MIMNSGMGVAALFTKARQQGRDPTPAEVKDSLKNLDDRLGVAETDIKDLQSKAKPKPKPRTPVKEDGKPPAGG